MADELFPSVTVHAVVVTSIVTPAGDVIALRASETERTPIVLYQHADEAKCQRMLTRIRARWGRILGFGRENCIPGSPILTVMPVVVKAPRQAPQPMANAPVVQPPGWKAPSKSGGRKRS